MGIKNASYILLALLFFGCKPEKTTTPVIDELVLPNVSSIGDSNKIEVITWNIEYFPKIANSEDYVKAIIEGLDADIYLLQEINSKNRFASMVGEMDGYNYYIQSASTNLNLAIIYKSNLVNIKSSIELFVDDPYYFAGRPPLLTKVEWQEDGIIKNLSIINVHYKCCGNNLISNIPDDDGKWDEEYRRLKASELLEKYISDNLTNDNVIVAGDFNDAIDEVDSTNVFLAFLSKPAKYRFADMNIATGDKANWSWQGWNSSYPATHIDHILVNNNLFDELENSSVVDVIKLEEYFAKGSSEYDKNVSDHRPVYLKFSP